MACYLPHAKELNIGATHCIAYRPRQTLRLQAHTGKIERRNGEKKNKNLSTWIQQ